MAVFALDATGVKMGKFLEKSKERPGLQWKTVTRDVFVTLQVLYGVATSVVFVYCTS